MNEIIHGNCVNVMAHMKEDSIDLVITSPPYDGLRKYRGYDFEADQVLIGLHRILKPGGVVVWVITDQCIGKGRTLSSFRQAFAAREAGFLVYDTMIWRKTNPMPRLAGKRYTNSFEYMFILSKGEPATFNPLMVPCSTAGKKKKNSYSHEKGQEERDYITKEEKPRSNVWDYPVGTSHSIGGNHTAGFPEELAADHIKSWSKEGELVLDPMVGTGTTCIAARRLGRNYIGIDISEDYCQLAQERLARGLV